jgi:hypothetical protein
MELKLVGNQLVLSGRVVGDELQKIAEALSNAPGIDTVILRNSPGGDVPTGYRVGELFRERSLRTAVSGFCYSSCSRMFSAGRRAISPTTIGRNTPKSACTGITAPTGGLGSI